MSKYYDKCPFKHRDCFALLCDGSCFSLQELKDYDKDVCPFYKTAEDISPLVMAKKFQTDAKLMKKKVGVAT